MYPSLIWSKGTIPENNKKTMSNKIKIWIDVLGIFSSVPSQTNLYKKTLFKIKINISEVVTPKFPIANNWKCTKG